MNLENSPKEQVFWLANGKTLKNVIELNKELQTMQQETFTHHVNEKKNDFANWIEYTLKDKQLATLLRTTKNQQRMQAIIERQIQHETIDKITNKPVQITKPLIEYKKPITPPLNIEYKPLPKQVIEYKQEPKKIIEYKPKIEQKIIKKIETKRIEKKEIKKIETKRIEKPEHKIIKTKNVTKLGTPYVYIHEVNKKHHSGTLLLSHTILGIVAGVAAAMLIYALK